jgi:hypothetical protein
MMTVGVVQNKEDKTHVTVLEATFAIQYKASRIHLIQLKCGQELELDGLYCSENKLFLYYCYDPNRIRRHSF